MMVAAGAALLFATAVPAAAIPGMAVGDGGFGLNVAIADPDSFDSSWYLPDYHIHYSGAVGTVHEDGFDSSFTDFDGVWVQHSLYAYAFTDPFTADPVSQTSGRAHFEGGIIGTISNPGATAQLLELMVGLASLLRLEPAGPYGFATGSIGYRVSAFTADGPIFTYSYHRDLFAPAYSPITEIHNDGGLWQILLNPGDTVTVRLDDAHTQFFIRAAVVPEPASWAMLIAGFGLVGVVARRRPATSAR